MIEYFSLSVAAAMDSFFLTGWFFLGTAVMAVALPIYGLGEVPIGSIFLFCAVGSFVGSATSFLFGKHLSHLAIAEKFLERPSFKEAASRIEKSSSTLTIVFLGKFIGVIRPFYAIALGVSGAKTFVYMLAELLASIIWSLVWSTVLYLGAETLSEAVRLLF